MRKPALEGAGWREKAEAGTKRAYLPTKPTLSKSGLSSFAYASALTPAKLGT